MFAKSNSTHQQGKGNLLFVHSLLPYPLDDYFKYAQKVQCGSIQIIAGKQAHTCLIFGAIRVEWKFTFISE
jgi:hypothetical protein